VLGESFERGEHIRYGAAATHGLRGLERPSAHEDGKSRQQRPLCSVEEVVAPLDGGYASAARAAMATPSRVFPIPPGPVSVTRRTSCLSSICAAFAISPSRPTRTVSCAGRWTALVPALAVSDARWGARAH
jgi:hypothetical protein